MKIIKEKRLEKKITQETLGKELGVKQGAVSAWESGKAIPKADKLPKLAKVLGCRVEDLFEQEEEE